MAPIVIPKVVFPGCKTPGTWELLVNSEFISDVAAAARVVQKNTMIKNTIT
jgi:hypothetical protein